METIPHTDCINLGFLQKPYGVRGEVVLKIRPGFAASLEKEPVLFVELEGLLVPFFIAREGIRFRTEEDVLVKFDWVDQEEQARKICGKAVFLKKEDWIREEGTFFVHHLTGFSLIDSRMGPVGPVKRIDDYGGNLVLQVNYRGKEVLLPLSEDLLVSL
ncbi:MAG: ribosome maturation factor RimM, partial [Mangrovibacterium sp.]